MTGAATPPATPATAAIFPAAPAATINVFAAIAFEELFTKLIGIEIPLPVFCSIFLVALHENIMGAYFEGSIIER